MSFDKGKVLVSIDGLRNKIRHHEEEKKIFNS